MRIDLQAETAMGHPAHLAGGQVSPERTCAEQGVPVKITDPLVLDKVAKILRPDTEQDSGSRQLAWASVAPMSIGARF